MRGLEGRLQDDKATRARRREVITVKDFLEHYIDKYLMHDVADMMRPQAQIGFPLLMTVFAGMELMGGLLDTSTFKMIGKGEKYFSLYWRKYLYPSPSSRSGLGPDVYKRMRNGIAHGFIVMGKIGVTTSNPQRHLTVDVNGVFYIDAVQFAKDFIESYEVRIKPLLDPNKPSRVLTNMKNRLKDIADEHAAKAVDYPLAGADSAPLATTTAETTKAPELTPVVSSSIAISNAIF